jgi:hypothetical protein
LKAIEGGLIMQTIREIINENREYFIQQLEEIYTGEPETNWNNIFDNVVTEFECNADDEASADENGNTIQTNYEQGNYDEIDINNSFDNFIMFLDIREYDF